MKKRVIMVLALGLVEAMLCMSVTGCGASEPVEEAETTESTEDSETTKTEEASEEPSATVEPTKTPEPSPSPEAETVEEEKDAFDTPEAIADGANDTKKEETKKDDSTKATSENATDAVTEVDRYYVEDCGQDTGYWVVKYSDGHEEYIEE